MVKNKFLKYSLILVITSFISKILALIIKIFETRVLDFKLISLVSLLFPTFNILITLSLFGTPLATQILVSKSKYKEKDILFTNIVLSFLITLLLSIIVLIIAKSYIYNVLKNKNLLLAFKSLILILPITLVSQNIRSFLNGKSRYMLVQVSSILEYLIKLLATIFFFKYFNNINISLSITFIFLLNIVYESITTLFLIHFINKDKMMFNKEIIKDDKRIVVSYTLKEIINSFIMFLEPILITNLYSKEVLNKYLYMINYNTPLLLAPTFIITSLSSLLITSISKCNNKKDIITILKKVLIFIIVFSCIYLFALKKFDTKIVYLIFKIKGPSFIKKFPFTFILLYIEGVFSILFDALEKSKINLYMSVTSSFVRSFSLVILSFTSLGINSYIYSLNINIIITFILDIYFLKRIFFHKNYIIV